jgi:hypothetical protein
MALALSCSFQLFDFLSAGEVDLRQGSYFVPDDEMSEDHQDPTGASFQRRCFTTVDFLCHRGLSNIQYSGFFNQCRLNGLAFDMQDRLGTVRPRRPRCASLPQLRARLLNVAPVRSYARPGVAN